MKRFLWLFIILNFSADLLKAQDGRGILKIRTTDDLPIMVRIDKRYYNEKAPALTVDKIPQGRHRIRIYKSSGAGFVNRNLLYDGYVHIQPGRMTTMVVNRKRKSANITASSAMSGNKADHTERLRAADLPRRKRTGFVNRQVLTEKEWNDLKDNVEKKITDTERITLMKSALSARNAHTEQIERMLPWLVFDSSKMEFVLWAYDHVMDPEAYGKLELLFSFESSKEEFSLFLNGR